MRMPGIEVGCRRNEEEDDDDDDNDGGYNDGDDA